MPAVTIRNLSEETHRALKHRAKQNKRSTEAEIRAILNEAAKRDEPIKLGTELYHIGQRFGGVELDIERDTAPSEGVDFS